MEELKAKLDLQFSFNCKTNFLCDNAADEQGFSPATLAYVRARQQDIKSLGYQKEELLLHYLVGKAIESCYRTNQYFYCTSSDKGKLEKVYRKLLQGIRELSEELEDEELQRLAMDHYAALRTWLRNSKPFAKREFTAPEPHLNQEVVCSAYAASTQLDILGIEVASLQEPILDLGCGAHAALVKFLRSLGFEVYGVDRQVAASEYLYRADWFDFELTPESWGAIISNVSFSYQFQQHQFRDSREYALYELRYREILQSLKPGGSFYYAPDLPIIEQNLNTELFDVQKLAVPDTLYNATRVVKK